jgi:hypothetical protein
MVSTRYKHLCYGWIIREARKKPAVQENLGGPRPTAAPHNLYLYKLRNVSIALDTTN